jgi:hypothetical protein
MNPHEINEIETRLLETLSKMLPKMIEDALKQRPEMKMSVSNETFQSALSTIPDEVASNIMPKIKESLETQLQASVTQIQNTVTNQKKNINQRSGGLLNDVGRLGNA